MTLCEIIGLQLEELQSDQEVLTYISDKLIQQDIVKQSFKEAITQRELEFPTGLNVGHIGIAIPHTDVEHVNTSSLAITTLKEPVIFKQMGDNQPVNVSLICVLALKEAHQHLEMLQRLIEFCQDEQNIQQIIDLEDNANNRALIIQLLKQNNII